MKKISALIILLITTSAVFAQELKRRSKFPADSVCIITPETEAYHMIKMGHSEEDYKLREELITLVVNEAKKILPQSKYVDLPILHADYRTVNHLLETTLVKALRSERLIDAPQELIINDCKYSLLLTVAGHYGDISHTVFFLTVINNQSKKIEYVVQDIDDTMSIRNRSRIINRVSKMIKKVIIQPKPPKPE